MLWKPSFRQIRILLWKALLIRRRHYLATFLEISVLLIFYYLLVKQNNGAYFKSGEKIADSYSNDQETRISKCHPYDIIYAPLNEFTSLIMNQLKDLVCNPRMYAFNTTEEALAFRKHSHDPQSFSLVLFENTDSYSYTLSRFVYFTPDTSFEQLQYYLSAVIYSHLEKMNISFGDNWKVNRIVRDEAKVSKGSGLYFSYIIQLICLQAFQLTLKRLVNEKQSGAKDLLQLMGMNSSSYWISHFLNSFFVLFIQAIFITIISTTSWFVSPVITHTSSFLFFMLFLSFAIITLFTALFISIFFSKSNYATFFGIVFWFVIQSATYSILPLDPKSSVQIAWTLSWRDLFPTTFILRGSRLLFEFETLEIQSGLFTVAPESGTSFFIYFLLLITVCIIYIFLIFYLDAVWPFRSTPAHKWNFIFTKSYWSSQKSAHSNTFSLNPIVSEYIEPLPKESEVGVKVTNLSKSFGVGEDKRYAVSSLSLDFAKGQIHVLLGHNGAGKTTLMNMISGLIKPTSGIVEVAGYDVQTHLKQAQANMSVCPQQNLLFDELTVEEHLILFAILKNQTFEEAKLSSERVIDLVQLTPKKTTLANKLSGGMKRKLQLSLTLVSETPIIILDEPTSGLDPEARRAVWDVLFEAKRNKTIILTTHIMDEADALGDRISIISNGKLRCVGSPLFLKKLYGTGYILHLSINSTFNQSIFDQFIKMKLPQAYITRFNSAEAVYCIPETSKNVSSENEEEASANSFNQMSSFFNLIDQQKANLGIESYGVSITTIDDVFLKVTDSDTSVINDEKEEVKTEVPMEVSLTPFFKLQGYRLMIHQIKGLFLKRFHYAKRNWLIFVLQALVPCLLVSIIFTFLKTFNDQMDKDPTPVEINLFKFPKKIFYVGTKLLPYFKNAVSENGGSVYYFKDIKYVDKSLFDFGFLEESLEESHLSSPILTFQHFKIWSDLDTFPSLSIAINVLQQALIMYQYPDLRTKVTFKHLDPEVPLSTVYFLEKVKSTLLAYVLPVILALISAVVVLFPLHENQVKSKLIQKVTGISSFTFWLPSFLFDFLFFYIIVAMIMAAICYFDDCGAISSHFTSIATYFVLFLTYGYSIIPLSYAMSFLKSSPASVFNIFLLCNFAGVVGLNVLMAISSITESFIGVRIDIMKSIFSLFPTFAAVNGLLKVYNTGSSYALCRYIDCTLYISLNSSIHDYFDKCCPPEEFKASYLDWSLENGVYGEILTMILVGTLLMSLIIIFESNVTFYLYRAKNMYKKQGLPQVRSTNEVEDQDVAQEKEYVAYLIQNQDFDQQVLLVYELTKKYKNLLAVNNLSFSLHHKECFGLLGVNGAGKSTTFAMLTGDTLITHGNAYIKEYDIKNQRLQYLSDISYCPQFDALLDNLTPIETLFLFARLRGIPERYIAENVDYLIDMLDLRSGAKYRTKLLSGGTKRKVSLAIALIGSPSVILLDEPTTGVDPSSRRKVWSVLQHYQKKNSCSIILCSHSMEECEALCSRVGIMVKGEFKCLGTIQHLKNKFGQGYTIILKLKHQSLDQSKIDLASNYITKHFKNASLTDSHGNLVCYFVSDKQLSWAQRFELMERAKEEGLIEDFIISDTGLEQIFLSFARISQ